MCFCSGTDGIRSPHGLPMDLLNRILIIRTEPYSADEVSQILKIRADVEGVQLDTPALETLVDIGVTASLRYVQVLQKALSCIFDGKVCRYTAMLCSISDMPYSSSLLRSCTLESRG